MTDVFAWKVQANASGGGEFRTLKIPFGEGYSQEAEDGLNNDVQKWTVTYSEYKAKVATVLAFVRAHKGAIPFFWTPPMGVVGYYKCKSYKQVDQGGGYWDLVMEFEQGFQP